MIAVWAHCTQYNNIKQKNFPGDQMTIGSLRLGKMIKLLLRMSITNGIGFFD
jgi:hypothetical protein